MKDLLEILLGDEWRRKISEQAAFSHVTVNLTEAKTQAIYSPFYCSKCCQLLRTKEELNEHAFKFHPQLVKREEFGELTVDKLKQQLLNKLGSCEFGQKILSAVSDHFDNLTEQITPLCITNTMLAHPDRPDRLARFDFSNLPRFDDVAVEILERREQQQEL